MGRAPGTSATASATPACCCPLLLLLLLLTSPRLPQGSGSFVNDVTEARFRSKVVGAGARWVDAAAVSGREPPTPSARERGVCQIELRRAKLAQKGRLMLGPADCPLGCDAELAKKDARFHAEYLCPFRTQACLLCAAPVRVCDAAKHDAEECPVALQRREMAVAGDRQREVIDCPIGCEARIMRKDVDRHETFECAHRLERCQNPSCGSQVPLSRLPAHTTLYCGSPWMVKRRAMVVRARRKRYARPWDQPDGVAGPDGDSS